MKQENSTPTSEPRPSWDRSTPGKHPALRDMTPTEQELKQHLAAPSAAMLGGDERWRASRLLDVECYMANLRLFSDPAIAVEDRSSKVEFYRLAAAQALRDVGRIDEAIALCSDEHCNPRDGYVQFVEHLNKLIEAIECDDAHDCGCARVEATVADERKQSRPPVKIAYNRRTACDRVYSERHGTVVTVWQCEQCGHMNAHGLIPDRQIPIYENRAAQKKEAAPLPDIEVLKK